MMINRGKVPFTWVIIVFLLGALSFKVYSEYSTKRELKVSANSWDKLMLILSQIDMHYVDNVDSEAITEESIPLILQKLDPHSVYLGPKDLQSSEEQLVGNFDGIGIHFNVPNDTAIVINVVPGGPSERTGIMSGDRIVKVDGVDVAGVNVNQDSLVSKLRGKSGTFVNLDIKRVGIDNLLTFEIKRGKIPVKSVDVAYMLNDTLGYIKLSRFSRTSHSEFMDAVSHLRESGMRSLLFDLRGNSGGYLDQALLLSNEFLNKGDLIVYMEGRRRARQNFHADNSGKCKDLSIKVLIDEGSASSSEIFAGAIQDNDRGMILGRRSFGKGLVQEPIYFSDNSGIRLTVARFYTPTGRSIQKPYTGDDSYRDDIFERFKHGEMFYADSIKFNDSLMYTTPKGKIVYGGGGIMPDIFIPIDTTAVGSLFFKVTNLGLTFKFGLHIADKYRSKLNQVDKLDNLYKFFEDINIEREFKNYAISNGVRFTNVEWNESRDLILNHVYAYTARYSPLDDKAFYPIIHKMDNTIKIAIEQ